MQQSGLHRRLHRQLQESKALDDLESSLSNNQTESHAPTSAVHTIRALNRSHALKSNAPETDELPSSSAFIPLHQTQ